MSKSTQVITDLKTVAAATPTATTTAKQTSATGPITDGPGFAAVILLEAEQLLNKMNALKAATDGSDPLLTTLQQVIDVFV